MVIALTIIAIVITTNDYCPIMIIDYCTGLVSVRVDRSLGMISTVMNAFTVHVCVSEGTLKLGFDILPLLCVCSQLLRTYCLSFRSASCY